jgi:hypothetical protein
MGVPKGCILSVTLFSIKINSLAKVLSEYIEGFLYVDDFLICYRGKNMKGQSKQRIIQRNWQHTIHNTKTNNKNTTQYM